MNFRTRSSLLSIQVQWSTEYRTKVSEVKKKPKQTSDLKGKGGNSTTDEMQPKTE